MVFPNQPFPTLYSVLRWITPLRFHLSWQILSWPQIWEELGGLFKIFSVNKCELWMWGSAESPPVFSSAFALSCSDVFTINVRLLSVNTSIDTAQRFTAHASFWLSHLLNGRKRTETREWNNLSMATTVQANMKVQWVLSMPFQKKMLQRLSGHKQSLLSSQQVVTKINLDLANQHKESPLRLLWQLLAVHSYFNLWLTFVSELLTYANLTWTSFL